jgi:hypothetical protein
MSMIYLKKPAYKGRRFISLDGSSSIELKSGNKYFPVLSLLILTALGTFVSLRINKETFGIDQAVALLFWITIIYSWIRLLNMPVAISIKENRIFFTDYISNIKYIFIIDILSLEQKKSMVYLVSKSDKIIFQSSFEDLTQFVEELVKKNPQIKIIGFGK